MKNMENKKYIILSGLILFISIVIITIMYVDISQISSNIIDINDEISDKEIKILEINTNYTKLIEVENELSYFIDKLSKNVIDGRFIIKINDALRKSGVDLKYIDTKGISLQKEYGYIPMSLEIEGEYKDVWGFLTQLDNEQLFIQCKNFQITRRDKMKEGESANKLRVSISFYVYFKLGDISEIDINNMYWDTGKDNPFIKQ